MINLLPTGSINESQPLRLSETSTSQLMVDWNIFHASLDKQVLEALVFNTPNLAHDPQGFTLLRAIMQAFNWFTPILLLIWRTSRRISWLPPVTKMTICIRNKFQYPCRSGVSVGKSRFLSAFISTYFLTDLPMLYFGRTFARATKRFIAVYSEMLNQSMIAITSGLKETHGIFFLSFDLKGNWLFC